MIICCFDDYLQSTANIEQIFFLQSFVIQSSQFGTCGLVRILVMNIPSLTNISHSQSYFFVLVSRIIILEILILATDIDCNVWCVGVCVYCS